VETHFAEAKAGQRMQDSTGRTPAGAVYQPLFAELF
jgi:hypothetical protein